MFRLDGTNAVIASDPGFKFRGSNPSEREAPDVPLDRHVAMGPEVSLRQLAARFERRIATRKSSQVTKMRKYWSLIVGVANG